MSLSDKKQKYTITDGKGTNLEISSFGFNSRQIETIEKTLDVTISQAAENLQTLIVEKDRNSAREENVVGMAILALQYAMEHNRPGNETSQNSIKNEIKTLRASGKFSNKSEAQKFVEGDAGVKRTHSSKTRADKLRVKSFADVAAAAISKAPAASGQPCEKKKAEERNFPLSTMLEDGSLVVSSDKTFTPTPGQKAFLAAYDTSEAIIIDGPAGSGKTEYAIYMALRDLKLGKINSIILSASVQKGEEETGYLPGELEDKMGPMINQMLKKMDRHLGAGDLEEGRKVRERLEAKGFIQVKGLGDMGGESFERSVLILDEAHQATEGRLNIVIGRGENPFDENADPNTPTQVFSKVIMCGHSHQNVTESGASVYAEFWQKFTDPDYAGIVTCLKYSDDDVRRNRLLKIMARKGDDIPKAEREKAIRDSYSPAVVDKILSDYFNAKANGKIKTPAMQDKLDLYASKLVGQMDMVDLAMQLEANLLTLDKT